MIGVIILVVVILFLMFVIGRNMIKIERLQLLIHYLIPPNANHNRKEIFKKVYKMNHKEVTSKLEKALNDIVTEDIFFGNHLN